MGFDLFSGQPGPVVNYSAILPPPTNGLPVVTQAPPVSRVPASDGSTATGTPVAPAYGQNLAENIQRYLLSAYGTYVVTQTQFCVAYRRFTGFDCDFSTAISGVKDSKEWLAMLQREQDDRITVVANRPVPGAGSGPGTYTPRPGGSMAPGGGSSTGGGAFELSPMLILAAFGVIVLLRR
jgi:hypothetical protein